MQKFLYAVAGLVILLIVVGLALPGTARVVASIEIDARPATVFALCNDFHRVRLWSPAIESDPNARIVYAGPARGVGATMSWDGLIIGSGTQTITDSRPYEHVATVINPGERGEARSWFDVSAADSGTQVNWTFETDYGYNLVGRYAALLLNSVIRKNYEQGLANLKLLAESLPRADFSELQLERLVVEAIDVAYLPASSPPDPASISEAMGKSYFEILTFIDAHSLIEAGAPLAVMRSVSGARLRFDAAIPVRGISASTPRDDGGVKLGKTYAGTVIRVRHVGSYRNLAQTHARIAAYLAALGIERAGAPWESYISDPTRVPDAELLTYVYYPIVP